MRLRRLSRSAAYERAVWPCRSTNRPQLAKAPPKLTGSDAVRAHRPLRPPRIALIAKVPPTGLPRQAGVLDPQRCEAGGGPTTSLTGRLSRSYSEGCVRRTVTRHRAAAGSLRSRFGAFNRHLTSRYIGTHRRRECLRPSSWQTRLR